LYSVVADRVVVMYPEMLVTTAVVRLNYKPIAVNSVVQ
jgi:hypothetical protein